MGHTPTVLVTGATGFSGSHILEAFSQAANEGLVKVIAACRDEKKLPNTFTGEVRAGDMLDAAYVEQVTKGVDIICHAAAWSTLFGHREQVHKLYLEPSVRLIDSALANKVSRFLYVSTTAASPPGKARDALSPAEIKDFWPQLDAVVGIENALRQSASEDFTAISMRLGLFCGKNYSLGLLPILLPRLKTHLVPWIDGGRTPMPLIDGQDIGQSFLHAALASAIKGYDAFNIIGPETPRVKDVISFLHEEFGYPKPHFGVPFSMAYPFSKLMGMLDSVVPWDPLIVPSIVYILEDFGVDNIDATARLGYVPKIHWKDSIREQLTEMKIRQKRHMPLRKDIPAIVPNP